MIYITDLQENFILSIPAYDERAVPKSILVFKEVADILHRTFALNVQSSSSVAITRQKCLTEIRRLMPNAKEAYTFWLDSDIHITEEPEKIAEYIVEAEKMNVSFTGNYIIVDNNVRNVWNVITKKDKIHYTPEELLSAKAFELKCEKSGLGLCYIKTPIDYEFRTTGRISEDDFFYEDNPQLDLRYVPIANYHIKTIHFSDRIQ